MSYYTPNDHDRERLHTERHIQQGQGGSGWLFVIGIIIAAIVALVVFSGGGVGTSDVHPGGAGAPPVVIQNDAETAPGAVTDTRPVAPAE